MVTETWLNSNTIDAAVIASLNIPPFSFISFPRPTHAGIGLLYHNNLKILNTSILEIESSEIVIINMRNMNLTYKIIIIYRPQIMISSFIEDFNNFIVEKLQTIL